MTTGIFKLPTQEDGRCTEKVINVKNLLSIVNILAQGWMVLVAKHNVGLKTLLYNVISEAIIDEDVFCELRNIVRSPLFLISP